MVRHCSKPGCNKAAVGTLTYDYKHSTAVVGPLATVAEPHTYDLCEQHITSLTVPRGWEVVRLQINYDEIPPSDDDLMDLVEAVRQAAEQDTVSVVSSAAVANGFSHFSEEKVVPNLGEAVSPRTVSRRDRLTVVSGEADQTVSEEKPGPEEGPF